MIDSQSEVIKLHKIAANLQTDLHKLGIKTIAYLLWYFPWRYDDLSEIKQVKDLTEGEIVTVKVKILKLKSYRAWKRKMLRMIARLVGPQSLENPLYSLKPCER